MKFDCLGDDESREGQLVKSDVSASWAEDVFRARMLKRQAPTTVFLRTHFTQTIKFHPVIFHWHNNIQFSQADATLTMDFELSLDYATIQALSLHNLKYDVYVCQVCVCPLIHRWWKIKQPTCDKSVTYSKIKYFTVFLDLLASFHGFFSCRKATIITVSHHKVKDLLPSVTPKLTIKWFQFLSN